MFTYVPRRVLGDSIAGPSLEFQRGSTSRRSCFQKTNTQIIGIKIKVPNDRALFVWLTNGGGTRNGSCLARLEQFMLRIVTFRVYSHTGSRIF